MSGRHWQRWVGLGAASLALAACASTSTPKPTTTTTDPTTTTAPRMTTTTVPLARNAAAVLATWTAVQRDYLTGLEDKRATDLGLSALTTPAEHRAFVSYLELLESRGVYAMLDGPFNLGHPVVHFTGPTTATVTTCTQDDWIFYYTVTGKPVPGIDGIPTMTGEVDQMVLVDGHWLYGRPLREKQFPYDGGHGTCPGYDS